MKKFFQKNKVLKLILVTYLIVIFPFGFAKSDYYFMSPGPPYQWNIEVSDTKTFDSEGNLFQLTVRRDEANYFVYAWANLNNEIVSNRDQRKIDRFITLGLIAAEEAIKDSGFVSGEESSLRSGVMVGSGIGGLDTIYKNSSILSKVSSSISFLIMISLNPDAILFALFLNPNLNFSKIPIKF